LHKHFEESHYVCKVDFCPTLDYIVFSTMNALDKHIKGFHSIANFKPKGK